MPNLYANIRKLREEKGMSQETLARLTGYTDRSSIAKIEKGLVDLQQSKIDLFANALGTTAKALVGWDDDETGKTPDTIYERYDNIHPIEVKRFPLLGEIACGNPIYADEDRESYVMAGTEIRADFCLKAKGDSMIGARIHDGDIVFIKKDVELVNGRIYAVIIDNEATLKRVYYRREQGIVQLLPENPEYEPIVLQGEDLEQLRILGEAIAFQSDVK